MTDLADRRRDATARTTAIPDPDDVGGSDASANSNPDSVTETDHESVADEILDRAERVRRQELDTALDRLAARGEVTPETREAVADLSTAITSALVARWVAALAEPDDSGSEDTAVDPEIALELLTER